MDAFDFFIRRRHGEGMPDHPDLGNCPYQWCRKTITLVPAPPYPGSSESHGEIIKAHEIKHPMLTGPCPASNLRFPLDAASRDHLWEKAGVDGRRLPKMIVDSVPERENRYRRREHGPEGSQTLRGPQRIGREPEPDSPDWQLGGREDEESGKVPGPTNYRRPPMGVLGIRMGNSVASIGEVRAALTGANLKNGEAYASLQEMEQYLRNAIGSLEAAVPIQGEALEGSGNDSVASAYIQMQEALASMLSMLSIHESALSSLNGAMGANDAYIALL